MRHEILLGHCRYWVQQNYILRHVLLVKGRWFLVILCVVNVIAGGLGSLIPLTKFYNHMTAYLLFAFENPLDKPIYSKKTNKSIYKCLTSISSKILRLCKNECVIILFYVCFSTSRIYPIYLFLKDHSTSFDTLLYLKNEMQIK